LVDITSLSCATAIRQHLRRRFAHALDDVRVAGAPSPPARTGSGTKIDAFRYSMRRQAEANEVAAGVQEDRSAQTTAAHVENSGRDYAPPETAAV
jgi:hypothetical protein